MTRNLSPEIRQLPLYRAGLRVGIDISLRIGLDAITHELTTQDEPPARNATREAAAERDLVDLIAGPGETWASGFVTLRRRSRSATPPG